MIPLPDRPQVASAGDVLGEAPQHHGRKSSPPTATSKSAHRASVGDFSAFTGQQHTMPHIGSSSASCTQASHPPSSFSNGKQNRNRLSITRFSASGSSLMGYMAAAHHHQHSKELPAEVIASGYDVRAPDFESMLANDDLVVKVDLDSAARLDGGVEEPPLRHMEQLPHQVSTGLLGIGVTTVTTQVEQHFAPPPSMIGTPSSFLAPNLGHGELTEAQKVMLDYTSQAPASSPLRSHPSSPASGAFPGITATPSYAAGTGSLRSHWDFENVPRARVSPGTGFFTIDALDRATTGQELDAPVKRSKKSFFRRPSINIGTVFSEPNPGAKSKRDPLSPAANVSGFASASDVQHGAIHRSTSANNLFGKVLVDEPVQPYSTRPYVHGGVSSNSSDLLHQKQHASNEHESKNAYSDLVGSSASLPRAFPPQPHSADSRYLGNHSASESNSSFPSPHTQRIEEARSGTRSESPSLHKHSQPASASSSTKSRGRIQKLKTSFGRKVSSSKSNKSTSEDDDLRTPAAASFVSPLAGSSGRKSSRSRGREAAQDELVFVLAQRHARQVSSQLPEQDVFSILPHPQSGFLHRLGLALDSEKEEMSPTCSASTTSGRTPHSDSRSTFGSSEYSLTTPAGSTDSHVFGSQGHYLSERRRSSIRSHDPSPGFDLRGDEDGKEVMYSPPRPFMDSAQGAITTRPRQAQRPRSRPRTRAGEVADEEQASMPSLPSSAMTASSDTRSLSSVEAANRSTDSLGSSSHSEQRIGRAPPSQAPVATSQQKYPPTSLPTSFVRPPRHRPPLPTAEAPAVPMRRKNMDTRSTMTNFAGSSAPRRRVKMQLVPTELLAQGGGVMKAGVKSGHAVLDRDGELMYIAKRAKGLAAGGGVRTVLHRGCATGVSGFPGRTLEYASLTIHAYSPHSCAPTKALLQTSRLQHSSASSTPPRATAALPRMERRGWAVSTVQTCLANDGVSAYPVIASWCGWMLAGSV